jgi:2-hydroxychromene-2-carboxylate isomerase
VKPANAEVNPMKNIEYYFSPSSPWTYLGHLRLVDMARRHQARIEVLPVDIGGSIFPGSGGLPLAKRAPQRQAYRLVELRRWSTFLAVPLNLQPRHFPTPGHDAAKLIILAGQRHGSDAAVELSHAVMQALWAQEQDIGDLATLARLADGCSLPGEQLVADLAQADEAYAANTRRAIDAQVFGAPWYRYRDEPFWGQDRLDFLDRALAAAT